LQGELEKVNDRAIFKPRAQSRLHYRGIQQNSLLGKTEISVM
jgi:hypothetical protein